MYIRHLQNQLSNHFPRMKEVIILLGARQVGKTTLLKSLFPQAQYLNVDTGIVQAELAKFDITVYKQLLDPTRSPIILDEIQRIADPGRAIKIIYDQLEGQRVIATGSSSLHIKNKTSESLAGRKIDYHMYPLTLSEYLVQLGLERELSYEAFEKIISHQLPKRIVRPYDHQTILDTILTYGTYPAATAHAEKARYLKNLVDSVIFKDLTELSLLENKSAALALLRLVAHQIGSLVSYAELASKLGISAPTVKRYIELFEQSFLIFRLYPYSSNKRDEIGKAPKIYFHDLGLRNALINNFNPLATRGDAGQLFENFIISEIYKYNDYGGFDYTLNYWRTKSGSEVDLVLSKSDGTVLAVEIKSHPRRINQSFVSRYSQAQLSIISRDNYWV